MIIKVLTLNNRKHGHAKCHLLAIDILTKKKFKHIIPSSHNCDLFHMSCINFQFIDIFENRFLFFFIVNGITKDNLCLSIDKACLCI
uniref:Translation initiation factor 5A-like N-terminal domain-containing protein n=2 Tax=Physcomitrium patens TaxID=3218 RepID=A0A7I3ZRF2_PHYPA